ESGEEKLDLQPHAPGQLMQEAATALKENAHAAEVELILDASSGTSSGTFPGTQVLADGYAIQQVLGNLISNALRYAQSGKKIVLGATEQAHQVEFYVRDFGPGIPSEHLPRIFERFYRVDK